MAITFSDLHTEAGLKTLEDHLSKNTTFISGCWEFCYCFRDEISKDDVKVFGFVPQKPGNGFPNASRWYSDVEKALASRFPGSSVGVKFAGQASSAPAPAAAASQAAAEEEDDDDLGLFEDETEEEKKVAEERAAAAKASTKKKESGKSSVLLDVKPWDDETDMKKLEEVVRSIEMPGLHWGASKLVSVGYGIKKLQIMMTIVDDLVSVDDLIEERLTVEPANEYIQSCDIVAFNKI
ncbi:elongation factor 1-beta-like [Iris pallida]|uniref:Elongation factor 1-beta-like n=1 Tax=Iris pallida TaxID=29817 RepID=A0AAX6FQ96_IRIPA|nr:elongation factor 1-beta-like [Iris pallida]